MVAKEAADRDSNSMEETTSSRGQQELFFNYNSSGEDSIDLEIVLFGPSINRKKRSNANPAQSINLNRSDGSEVDFLDYF